MRASSVEEGCSFGPGDPWDVFAALVLLVVEGRTPGGDKGFRAGPHCPLPQHLPPAKHSCDQELHLCVQAEALVRQLRLMWGAGVEVKVEVLVAPECDHGKAIAECLDAGSASVHDLKLIEQWSFSILERRKSEVTANGWSLIAAVRSFLSFSQLSAWLSISQGRKPTNILYRLTSSVVSSKFNSEVEEHHFPVAYLGQGTSAKVSVLSLTRSGTIPVVICSQPHLDFSYTSQNETAEDSLDSRSKHAEDVTKDASTSKITEDLRRCMMKAKLSDTSRASRSESPDTQLGESLLDPPNSLYRFPKRYQSPSRSSSPSLETPEHVMSRPRPSVSSFRPFHCEPHYNFSWTQSAYPITNSKNLSHSSKDKPYFVPRYFSVASSGSSPRSVVPHKSALSPQDDRNVNACASRTCDSQGLKRKVDDLTGINAPGSHNNSFCHEDKLRLLEDAKVSQFEKLSSNSQKGKEYPYKQGEVPKPRLFDLTPKETMEVLTVLRHNTPVPPLRIERPSTSSSLTSLNYSLKKIEPLSGTEEKNCFYKSYDDQSGAYCKAVGEPYSCDKPSVNSLIDRREVYRTAESIEKSVCDYPKSFSVKCTSTEATRPSDKVDNVLEASVPTGVPIRQLGSQSVFKRSPVFSIFVSSGSKKSEDEKQGTLGRESVKRFLDFESSEAKQEKCAKCSNDESLEKVFEEHKESIEENNCHRNLEVSFEDSEVSSICEKSEKKKEISCAISIPSAHERINFRRSLDSATNMVFHNKTGLPLTSSPAPLRKGTCFDFDSSLTSVRAITRSTSFSGLLLYSYDCDEGEEEEWPIIDFTTEGSTVEGSHDISLYERPVGLSSSAPATLACSNLLGSFEECVLNGRLEPVSTVQGFRAEIAASGSFIPKHISKPVTVFFYTLSDNDQVSSPYMGHINLGKKGYYIPQKGTVQVTLFNPHGTVVKMFVVVYDLSDMPPNSRTFLRQRTLYMPVGTSHTHPDAHQWLRYLIHLRFASSKSGKIYLHTDIRLIIFRKSDADAAAMLKTDVSYELRSFTHGPSNPKFSPRK